MTLSEAMPYEFSNSGEFYEEKSYKFKDVNVIWENPILNGDYKSWPGKHKNVHFWVILENGYAVGWNENPSKGWSFPLIRLTKVE